MPTIPSFSYGVDLGTTFSAASYVATDGSPNMINPNTGTLKSIPSCVLYEKWNVTPLIGVAASTKAKSVSKTLIYDSKRLIGKYYKNIDKKELDSFPFECVEDDKQVKYKITLNGREGIISPIEVSSEILKYIHKISLPQITHQSEELSSDNIHITIGIPAIFSYHQREATLQAAEAAGLKNIKLLSEPSAAALAYIQSNNEQVIKKSRCNLLVYDFGGGTFDVSIIRLDGKNISLKVTYGDDHLGGQDITRRLEEYIKDDIKKTLNIDVSTEKMKLRIHNACDEAKINLSVAQETDIYMEISEEEYSKTVSRATLTNLCSDLFKRTIDVVNQTLNVGDMSAKDIDYIVLVGGSSRLPQVTEYIRREFKGIPICKSVNPDEAVAIGCAIYANYKLNGESPFIINDVIPALPISFGIDLGTTFSCSAYYDYTRRNYAVISTNQPTNSIPSVIAFEKKKSNVIFGTAAAVTTLNKYSTIADAKRYLNKKFETVEESDFKYNKYKLVEGRDGFCEYEVEYNNTKKKIYSS